VEPRLLVTLLAVTALLSVAAQEPPPPSAAAPATSPQSNSNIQQLQGKTLHAYKAAEATQGVAADLRYFYAVDNSTLGKYSIRTGELIGRWTGAHDGPIRHMNSCLADARRLWCANSNYPQIPMGSSIEVFDPASMKHVDTHSLGMLEEGSLTWFDRYRGGWIAGFSHYDKNGGVPYKDHSFSSVVTFDLQWRRTGGWLLPAGVLERMAPYAASGGAVGPDGWLYLLGHDRPEMYVVGRPAMGPVLTHIATIALEAEGQAFSWAKQPGRVVFTIDRRQHLVRRIELPPVDAGSSGAQRFR
jgi:hypothetical protein